MKIHTKVAKRLTENQKWEIIKSFTEGKSVTFLSKEFNCSNLTIIRNLKKHFGELVYKRMVENNKTLQEESSLDKEKLHKKSDIKISNEKINKVEISHDASFIEIAPLDYEIESSMRKELASVNLSNIDLPKQVYMIVDKKIELEIKLLKDYPEWQFLPIDDLNRKTIEIYSDLKIAKRLCSKEQKVIKVPNTDVFRIASPFLIARGISRIVSADNLIAL